VSIFPKDKEQQNMESQEAPVLLGKRGARLEYAECIHRTTNANDLCFNCGRYVGEGKPDPEDFPHRGHVPGSPTFGPVEVPPQHFQIAKQLYQRRTGITVATLAKGLKMSQRQVQNGLQYLNQNGLAQCHGRRAAAHWAATVQLRTRNVIAA
jgi:hypothetical protein